MQFLTSHKVNPANSRICIEACDEPDESGAHHEYAISLPESIQRIKFQKGPVDKDGNGVNGITQEVLLAIVEHRLQCFQTGPYACRENALALTHIQEAMHWLYHRTRARMERGVEGTHQV